MSNRLKIDFVGLTNQYATLLKVEDLTEIESIIYPAIIDLVNVYEAPIPYDSLLDIVKIGLNEDAPDVEWINKVAEKHLSHFIADNQNVKFILTASLEDKMNFKNNLIHRRIEELEAIVGGLL